MKAGFSLKPATKTNLHKLDADMQGTPQVYQACVKRTDSVKQIEGLNRGSQVRIWVQLFILVQH